MISGSGSAVTCRQAAEREKENATGGTARPSAISPNGKPMFMVCREPGKWQVYPAIQSGMGSGFGRPLQGRMENQQANDQV